MGDQKNLILAAVLSFLVIGLWEAFVIGPQREQARIAQEIEAARLAQNPTVSEDGISTPGGIGSPTAALVLSREDALAGSDRIMIDSPAVDGSISLVGGRIDDLNLKDYNVTIEEGSPEVTLLSPENGPSPYYSVFGWVGSRDAGQTPNRKTEWKKVEGSTLGLDAPVVLEWTNDDGLTFRKRYEIDKDYLFTVTQEVTNSRDEAVTLRPYGVIARHGEPETLGMYLLHEGAIGAYDGITEEMDYDEFAESPFERAENSNIKKIDVAKNGYIGFTDKYWMTALIPEPGVPFTAAYSIGIKQEVYQTGVRFNVISVAPGASASSKVHFFAGAKRAEVLKQYEETLGVDRLYDAIDWGWFYFLTKPFFWLLSTIYKLVGNFGVAIILLTVLVKAAMFPLAYKSYVSMGRMKKLQPQTEKIREKHKEDPQAMQRAMMDLYKKEKVNPAAGCLPILLQIPVFFALYKVLFVTLEMRHAPFFGWIKDLSAPDPTSIFTGFGLFDWSLPTFLLIGIWPIIMGITMWMQMQLNPAPPDPIQKKIFAWMPVFFTLLLGSFPAGLVIYWTANNVLTIVQQATIMKSQGAKIELFDNMKALFTRKKTE